MMAPLSARSALCQPGQLPKSNGGSVGVPRPVVRHSSSLALRRLGVVAFYPLYSWIESCAPWSRGLPSGPRDWGYPSPSTYGPERGGFLRLPAEAPHGGVQTKD